MKSEAPLSICIISTSGSGSVGGLASYMRGLGNGLCREWSVRAIARFQTEMRHGTNYAASEQPRVVDNGDFQTYTIAAKPSFRPALRQLHHLTSRRFLRGLAVSTFRAAYSSPLRAAMPKNVDVVHYVGNGWELLGFAALAEARRHGAAFTVWPAVHPGAWGDSGLDVALYNQADRVFTQSEHERQHLARKGVARERMALCGLAPATQGTGNGTRFRTRHALGQHPLVLFVGRKDRGKGCHALWEAMPRILDAVPDARLVTIGPDREPPYPHVPEGALLDLGCADEAEKEDALAACDVLCVPSAHEAFGIVYVEAWEYGKPVVGGPAPAVRALITEGENGFCVPQEPQAIADILVRLLQDPALCARLGANGRALQQARYTWDAVIAMHKAIFEDVIRQKAAYCMTISQEAT